MSVKIFWAFSLLLAGPLLWGVGCSGNTGPAVPYNPHAPTPTPTNTLTPLPTRGENHTPTVTATNTATSTPTGTPSTPTITPTPYSVMGWSLFATLGQYGTTGANGNFALPMGVAVGAGYIAVSDESYENIQVFSSSGNYLYSITPYGGAPDLYGLAIDAYGELYSADYGSGEVDGYNLGPTTYTYDYTWTGQGTLSGPDGVKIDANGNLVVADYNNGAVYNLAWVDDSVLNQTTGGPAMQPNDVAVDASGNLYVADCYGQIDEFSSNYAYNGSFNGSTLGPVWTTGFYGCPDSVAVDSQGNLFISDTGNGRVVYADTNGNYLGEVDGFIYPFYLTLDPSDDLFVADGDGATTSGVYELTR